MELFIVKNYPHFLQQGVKIGNKKRRRVKQVVDNPYYPDVLPVPFYFEEVTGYPAIPYHHSLEGMRVE